MAVNGVGLPHEAEPLRKPDRRHVLEIYDRWVGLRCDLAFGPLKRGAAGFERDTLPMHRAVEDPTHLRLADYRRLHRPLEMEEAAMADHAPVGFIFDGPGTHADERPGADAGH